MDPRLWSGKENMIVRNTQTKALAEVDDEFGARLLEGGYGWEDAETPVKRPVGRPRAVKPEPTPEV